MTLFIVLGECFLLLPGERGGERLACFRRTLPTECCCLLAAILIALVSCFLGLGLKQGSQMGLNSKAGFDRVERSVGFHFGAIEIQLCPPHQSCCLTLLDNRFKKATKYLNPIALTDAVKLE